MKNNRTKKIMLGALCALLVVILYGIGLNCVEKMLGPVKEAVFPWEIEDRPYVICQPVLTTGFEWFMTVDGEGEDDGGYCVITGANPTAELGLNYPFCVSKNNYIFYVEEKKEYCLEGDDGVYTEYIVSGWDILYPVRHESVLDLLPLSGHILQSDCSRTERTGE